jgi:outer membrane protein TolC
MLICWLIFTFPVTIATSWANPDKPFTIQSAVDQSMERNPEVQKYRERIVEDHSAFSLAIAKVFPTVGFQGNSNYLKNPASQTGSLFGGEAYNQYSVLLNFNQPLWDGGALLAGYKYAKKDLDIRQKDLEVQQRTTTLSVLQAFYGVVLNQHLFQILQDDYSVQVEVQKIVERYYKIGRAQKLDVLQQKTLVASLPPQIAQADDNLKTAASQLAALVRELSSDGIRVKGTLGNPDLAWVQSTRNQYRTELPEIARSREAIAQFDDTQDIQLATYNPKLSFLGNYGRNSYTKTDLLDDNNTSWTIGLELDIPIFAGLSSVYQKRVLASQKIEMEKDDVSLNDTQASLEIQTEKNLEVAKNQLDQNRIAAQYGRESLDEADKDWRIATINYTQYQTSQQAYLTAETGYYQSQYNYIVAIANYFAAVGTPLEHLVTKLEELSNQATR